MDNPLLNNDLSFNKFSDYSDQEIVLFLMDAKSKGHDINKPYGPADRFVNVAHAVFHAHKPLAIEWLCQNGADLTAKSGNKNTPLTFFSSKIAMDEPYIGRDIRILKYLVTHIDFNQPGYAELTPLGTMLRYNKHPIDSRIMDIFIENTHVSDPKIFQTVLSSFLDNRINFTLDNLKKLMAKPEFDVNHRYRGDDAPDYNFIFLMAFRNDKKEFKKLLPILEYLDKNTKIDYEALYTNYCNNQVTPLLFAIENKNTGLMKFILKSHPESINDWVAGLNALEYCALHNFNSGISYFMKNNFNDKGNLLRLASDPKTIALIHKLHATHLHNQLDNDLCVRIGGQKKIKI